MKTYTKDDVAQVMEHVINEIRALRAAGQKEYAHQDDRPFRNFEELGKELNLTREKILWVYMRKHMDGVLAYINGHESQRESVVGRINDAIVYLILLRAMHEEEHQSLTTEHPILRADGGGPVAAPAAPRDSRTVTMLDGDGRPLVVWSGAEARAMKKHVRTHCDKCGFVLEHCQCASRVNNA